MILTKEEINRHRAISASLTALVFLLTLVFFFLTILTSGPSFPEPGGQQGQELALGMMTTPGNERAVNSSGISGSESGQLNPEQNRVRIETGAEMSPEVKPDNNNTPDVETIREEFLKSKGKTVEAALVPDESANFGGSEPSDNGGGNNGSVSGGNNSARDGKSGPESFNGTIGIELGGRAVVLPPALPVDTKEEGKVVVEITVDREGRVIEANPNGRGTNTSSVMLKAKARQAALATKFNVDNKFEEQRGTITIIFSFKK